MGWAGVWAGLPRRQPSQPPFDRKTQGSGQPAGRRRRREGTRHAVGRPPGPRAAGPHPRPQARLPGMRASSPHPILRSQASPGPSVRTRVVFTVERRRMADVVATRTVGAALVPARIDPRQIVAHTAHRARQHRPRIGQPAARRRALPREKSLPTGACLGDNPTAKRLGFALCKSMATVPVPSRRDVVNSARPGREQRSQRLRAPRCDGYGHLHFARLSPSAPWRGVRAV